MAVALFSYRREKSAMHKIPALAKITMLSLLCAAAFFGGIKNSAQEIFSPPNLIRISICLFISIVFFIMSGANRNSFRVLKFVFYIGGLAALFRTLCLPHDGEKILALNSFIALDLNGLAAGLFYMVQLFIATFSAQVIFETTSSLEIKKAAEQIESAASRIFPPVKKLRFSLALSLAINFIPQVFETWNKVRLASKARSPKKKNIPLAVEISFKEFSALLSCLMKTAETKRSALQNRS